MWVAHLEALTFIGGTTEPTSRLFLGRSWVQLAPKPTTCYFAALQEA